MTFANLSFEDGDAIGNATSWTWTRLAPFAIASFVTAAGGLSRFEGFEYGWGVDDFVQSIVVPTNASLPTDTPEDFERGWRLPQTPPPDGTHPGNETATFELGSVIAGTTDGFESGWQNDAFKYAFADGDCTAGTTDGFEAGWNNDSFEYAFAGGDLSAATFGGNAYENFEVVMAPLACTPDFSASCFLTQTDTGFVPNDRVTMAADDSNPNGRLPAGINPDIVYYVVYGTSTLFGLALGSGGATVAFTDNGIGSIFVVYDPTRFWTLTDVGV